MVLPFPIIRMIASLISPRVLLGADTIFRSCWEGNVEVNLAVDGVEFKTCRKVRA